MTSDDPAVEQGAVEGNEKPCFVGDSVTRVTPSE